MITKNRTVIISRISTAEYNNLKEARQQMVIQNNYKETKMVTKRSTITIKCLKRNTKACTVTLHTIVHSFQKSQDN